MNRQGDETCFVLKLYVAGCAPRSIQAIANFKAICQERLKGRCIAEIIDLLQNPKMAKNAQILATPTLVKESPGLSKEWLEHYLIQTVSLPLLTCCRIEKE